MSTPGQEAGPTVLLDDVEDLGSNAAKVAPGVHRIRLPLPDAGLRVVNVYAVESASGITLIDGGWMSAESMAALQTGLRVIGLSPADIAQILVTHAHRDHYPQAVDLRRHYGAKVGLSIGEQLTLNSVRSDSLSILAAQIAQLVLSDETELVSYFHALQPELDAQFDRNEWEEPDFWISEGDGSAFDAPFLTVVPTPGHTRGHVCFSDADRGLLFAGDHVLPHITPSIGYEPVPRELPLGDYLTSLARIRAMPDVRLLPGHGPVSVSVHARIDELVSHHDARLQNCFDRLDPAGWTAGAVARLLAWTRHNRDFGELNEFNQMLAVCETLAHLKLLAAQGRATQRLAAGVLYFAPAVTDGSTGD